MKILIADEMPDVGKRLERLFRNMPGVSTVNYCSSADDAILKLLDLQPDVLILGHQLKSSDGTEILRKVPDYSPGTEVCVYSAFLSEIDRNAYSNLDIHGFCDKSSELDSLLTNVEAKAAIRHQYKHLSPVPIS
ncbi:response regulator [bacterium]|nr:response regulator [bacterium]